MSWHPDDLVSDADLVAYERTLGKVFSTQATWQAAREKALEDWLWPLLEQAGFPRGRFRTRYAPTTVLGYTSSTFTDKTTAASDETTGDLPLATILATGSDALYIGSADLFRGLSWRLLDAVSSAAATLTVSAWCDTWRSLAVSDATAAVTGKPFSAGGPMTWTVPSGWVRRALSTADAAYWVKVVLSAAPTGATAAQVGVIRRSRLCGPAALRTLALIFREAPAAQDGPWIAKADWYEAEAERAWARVQPTLAGEFDTDEDDLLSTTEAEQTTAEATDEAGWAWERR